MARDAVATLPNIVSLSRLALAAVFVFATSAPVRLGLVGAAAATDFLDGFLARRRGAVTRLGAQIDPAADRAFMLVAVIVLWREGTLSSVGAAVMLARDVIVLAAWLVTRWSTRLEHFAFAARTAGKVLTVLQLAALACALVAPTWLPAVVGAVAVATVVALGDYAVAIVRGAASRAAGWALAATGAAFASGAAPAALAAQQFRLAPSVQTEVHGGIVTAADAAAMGGGGVNLPAGYYVRLGGTALAGRAVSGGAAFRAEVLARFLTDPFRQESRGPYGGAGVVVDWRSGDHGRPALALVGGLELRPVGGWHPALEIALGAGVRFSVVARSARRNGR